MKAGIEMLRTVEYDEFGPWILMVSTLDDVPPLFRDGSYDPATSLMAVKFPRAIERRLANPTMNLYDIFIDVRPDCVLIQLREEESRRIVRIGYSEIRASSTHTNLLNGTYTLHTMTDDLVLPFNAVSEDVISEMNHLILSRVLLSAGIVVDGSAHATDLPEAEFSNDYGLLSVERTMLGKRPEAVRVASQPEVRLPTSEISGLRKIFETFRPSRITGAQVYRYDGIVEILRHESWVSRSKNTDFTLTRVTFPVHHVATASTVVHPNCPTVRLVLVEVGASKPVELAFQEHNRGIEVIHALVGSTSSQR